MSIPLFWVVNENSRVLLEGPVGVPVESSHLNQLFEICFFLGSIKMMKKRRHSTSFGIGDGFSFGSKDGASCLDEFREHVDSHNFHVRLPNSYF